MKRRSRLVLACAAGVLAMASMAVNAEEPESYKVGCSLTSVTDPIFADFVNVFTEDCEELGWDLTLVDCEQDAQTQITQVENLITAGVDVLIIYPADADTMESICADAREKGIKVLTWDEELENADMSWLVYNYDLGKVIGQSAGEWINENYDGACEVAVLDYAMAPVIVERANGIIDGINETAPDAEIVAQDSAVTADVGMTVAENMLQAHPDIKVFACIGDGGGIGANEALKAKGVNLDEYGIFAADASAEALAAIKANEAFRMTVSLGSAQKFSDTLIEATKTMMTSDDYEKQIYKEAYPVTAENIDEYMAE